MGEILAALEVREEGPGGVDLSQAEAENIERAHLQHDERAAVLAEGEEHRAGLDHAGVRQYTKGVHARETPVV